MRHSGKVWAAAESGMSQESKKAAMLELTVTMVAAGVSQTDGPAGVTRMLSRALQSNCYSSSVGTFASTDSHRDLGTARIALHLQHQGGRGRTVTKGNSWPANEDSFQRH